MNEPGPPRPPSAVTLHAARSPEGGAFVVDVEGSLGAPAPPRTGARWIPAALAAIAAGAVAALFLFTLRAAQPEPPAEAASLENAAPANDAETWRQTDRSDPAALRKYIAANGRRAGDAAAALAALDRAAWSTVEQQDKAGGVLHALDEYDLDFPDGDMARDSIALRERTHGLVEAVEESLARQGYDPGGADGVITPETASAVRRYQAAMGLPATGEVDAALLGQLRATDASAAPAAPTARASAAAQASASAARARPFRDCYVCPEMAALPLGKTRIGDLDGAGGEDERPAHDVTIAYELAVGRFEVSFEEWDACTADGGCQTRALDQGWGRGRRPAIHVSWRDAREYAAWLSRKTGKRYRLLSEAEWEYAARAGAAAAYASGEDAARLCAHANHADSSAPHAWRNRACADGFPAQTAPVGSFQANAFGLHDMAGNVWEWVEDCWHDSYAGAPADGAAWTAACDRPGRVLRGGAWSVRAENLRHSYRYLFDADARTPYFGFRVAREGN